MTRESGIIIWKSGNRQIQESGYSYHANQETNKTEEAEKLTKPGISKIRIQLSISNQFSN